MKPLIVIRKILFIFFAAIALIACEEAFLPVLYDLPAADLKSQLPEPSERSISIHTIFGPEQFMQLQWRTYKETREIIIDDHDQYLPQYIIHIQNGSDNGDFKVSRGSVSINGTVILEIDDKNKKQQSHEIMVNLTENTILEVEISRRPVCFLTISIEGITKPDEETGAEAIMNAEEIFTEIQPVYLYLVDDGQGNLPVLKKGISAKYETNEDSTQWLASVTFSQYAGSTGHLINGTMDIKSASTGDPTQPPHQAYKDFNFDGSLTATGRILPELDSYSYIFHIFLNSLISWPDYPNPATKTVLTKYDFEEMSVFINNKSISPGVILDIMGK